MFVVRRISLVFSFLVFEKFTAGELRTTNTDVSSSSMLGFCNSEYYVPSSKKRCSQGFTLGKRPPKCMCIKGIYRLYSSNCDVSDGFAEEVCMLTQDDKGVQVKGVKLTKEPDWDKTAAVLEKSVGTSSEWEYIPEFSRGKSQAKEFYTINGEAFISTTPAPTTGAGKPKINICVQNKSLRDYICLYTHLDNVAIWELQKSVDVSVKAKCPDAGMIPLRPNKCFQPLTLQDSECQVPCSKQNIDTGGGGGGGGVEPGDLDKNVTDPRPYIKHDNNYLDRKLNSYLMMQEVGSYNVTPVSDLNHGPNKTFDLFQRMKIIVKNYCPSKYVPRAWINLVVELFHALHHGDIFKYENEINQEEHQWIASILNQCSGELGNIQLYHDKNDTSGGEHLQVCDGVPLASGYCKPEDTNGCTEMPVNIIPPPYNDYKMKHYVPEATWLVLDIVHVVCFPQFNESYRMFHLLEQTVEKLFTLQIKNYWYFPNWTARVKRLMLGTSADEYMFNMEICAESAYQSRSRQPHRLIRPDLLKYLRRKKRSAEALSSSYDVFCAKSKADWTGPDGCASKITKKGGVGSSKSKTSKH